MPGSAASVRLRCPYCGAEFEAPRDVTHAVCPYCGTVVEVETGSEVRSSYYPWRLEEQDAVTYALTRLDTLPGAPRDLAEAAAYRRGRLHMLSLYVARLVAEAPGCSAAHEEEVVVVRACRGPEGFPDDYAFPVVGRAPYRPGVAEAAVFHQVAWRLEEAPGIGEARAALLSRASREAAAMCESPATPRVEVELVEVAHYPVWELVYGYGGREYRVLVDAVEPRIVYAEYPTSRGRLARVLAAYAAGGAATAALLAKASLVALAGGVAGLVAAGLAVAAALLRRRLVYRGEKPWRPKTSYGSLH